MSGAKMSKSGEKITRTLGWAAVAIGAVICVMALFSFPDVVEQRVYHAAESDGAFDPDYWYWDVASLVGRFGVIWLLIYLAFGAFVAWVGLALARGSRRAVRGLQVACWAALVYLAARGILQFLVLRSFLAPASGLVSSTWRLPLVMAGGHLRLLVMICLVCVLVLLRRRVPESPGTGEA